MKSAALLCASLALLRVLAVTSAAEAASPGQVPVDLGPQLAPFVTQGKAPGIAAIVLRGDRIIAHGVAGVRRVESSVPIQADDEFELGSCGKAMTATLVAMLVEERKLSWDASLAEIFHGSDGPIDPAWSQVTILDLLHHRSGITKGHYVRFFSSIPFAGGDLARERRRFARKMLAHPPDVAPGTQFVYANANYLLVAAALERVTGQPWEDLIRRRLFQPLGMTTAGFGPPGTAGQIDQPWGHGSRRLFGLIPIFNAGDTGFDPGSVSADFPRAGAPAGLVHMSMADWAKFAVLHLRGDPRNPHCIPALLSEESFAVLHRPDPRGGRSEGLQQYSAGWGGGTRPWARGNRPGDIGVVLWHPGDNGRWNTVVWIAPEIDFAVLIACNRSGMWGLCDDVAANLVREFVARTETEIPGAGLEGYWEAAFGGQADGLQRLRLTLDIADTDPAHPSGILDSVDEVNSRFPVTGISQDDGVIRLEFTRIRATFEGKLNSEGSELAGRWMQNGTVKSLVFQRMPRPEARN